VVWKVQKKAAIIGLDGVPIELLQDLIARGVMPNLKEMLGEGGLHRMCSSQPPNSAISWMSMVTGVNPGQHGVYGFTGFVPGTYNVCYHHMSRLKAQPFWEKNPGRRHMILNLPASYSAQPINGVHVSGFVSPCFEKAVHPAGLQETLRSMGYMIDVEAPETRGDYGRFIGELDAALRHRLEAAEMLLRSPWDVFFLVFTGTDRIGHYLWDAYLDKGDVYHQSFHDYFNKVDEALGRLNQLIGQDTPLMMLSDHGMGPSGTSLNLNHLLKESGYLVTAEPSDSYASVRPESRAFAAETNKIYLNASNRFPEGSVSEADRERLTAEIAEFLEEITYRGRRAIRSVYTREALYRGPYSQEGPDLVVIPSRGFSLRTGLGDSRLFQKDMISGAHTDDNAFLYLRGCNEADVPDAVDIKDSLRLFNSVGGLSL
jgi:predicted AlkP superfamily phosphohydrolase/phosphomutase